MIKYFVAFILLCSVNMSAQENCNFRGMIVDSLSLPVFDASISAFDENNKSAGFTFSDKEGEFKLDLQCGKTYEIEIEHIAFEQKIIRIELDKSRRERIDLKSSKIALKDVVAQGRMPITIKGDTIEYDADSFKTGNEENLEDILKKLPGIQVEDGKVYYQGKQINSIKVEGREIFGGNTKLLTKNLPSDAVDKIQLNQKFKANPFANSLQDEEQPELNIVLKEDKKNLIFGNISIGGNADKHYDLQEKLFRFSRKTDATLISDFNTYGKEVFSNEDYFQFLGGISEFSEEGGANSLRSSMNSVLFGSGDKSASMQNHLGAFNFGFEPSKKLNISAFALAIDNNLKYKSSISRFYSEFKQHDENINDQNIFSFISRLRLDYTINNKSNLKYRINFNAQNEDNITDITSFIDESESPALYRKTAHDRQNSNLYQRLSYIRKVGRDHNFGLYLTHSIQNETPHLYLNSTEEPFSGYFSVTPEEGNYNLNQLQELTSQTFQALSVYNHLITNLSNLRVKIGANINHQKLDNQIFDKNTLINNEWTPTRMNFDFTELYADATYTRKINKFKFDLGTGIHRYNSENTGSHAGHSIEITRLLPHFQARYEISSSNSLNFTYKQTFEIPQIRELTEAFNIQNYYAISQGNSMLRETRYHQARLNYSLYNFYKFFNLFASVSYNQRLDNIRNEGYFNNLIQFSSPFNSKTPEENWNTYLYVSKRFTKIYTLRINGNASWSNFSSRNNNFELNNQNTLYTANMANIFKFRKKFEFESGLKWSNFNYTNELNTSEFTDWTPYTTFAWSVNEDFLIQGDYEYRLQYSEGEEINSNQNLNISFRYRPAKRVYLYFTAGNLLGDDKIVRNGFHDFYTSISSREILGRYFVGSIRYKF
ncbi:MAG: outer membrane beta-barrel protein [Flavobacteriaceae bacterium]|nr:outer membrane beta-barrel protein [Flavobacteriaceae bacterium]